MNEQLDSALTRRQFFLALCASALAAGVPLPIREVRELKFDPSLTLRLIYFGTETLDNGTVHIRWTDETQDCSKWEWTPS